MVEAIIEKQAEVAPCMEWITTSFSGLRIYEMDYHVKTSDNITTGSSKNIMILLVEWITLTTNNNYYTGDQIHAWSQCSSNR